MEKEVLEGVKETESDMIEKSVYSVYQPKVYNRRRDTDFEDSLANKENIHGEIIEDGVLRVHNDTKVNSGWRTHNTGLLTPIIKSGEGYDYEGDGSGTYLRPRDFEQDTVDELEHSGKLEQAMIKGLKQRGIKTK